MTHSLKSFLQKNHRLLFYGAWLLLQLVQAFSTELFDDEAYYWVYSIFPAWGYFDHPPMIAMLIKAGYALFASELGVRLFSVLLSTASIWLVQELLVKKNPWVFYAICASMALIQLGGMLAVPDTPLMFFVALFFFLYRRFVASMNLVNTLLLGAGIALMMYTKYHGVLIVLFTGLSNPRLFRQYQPWLACVFALFLFIPHLYWQYANGYPSLQFHLFERNATHYQIGFTLEFILGQILLAGPLIGWLLILAALRHQPQNLVEKALKFSFVGFYVFFLLSTFKGRAEANWTIPSFIGMMVLSHQYLTGHTRWRRWLYVGAPATLALVLAARVIMMIDLPPAWWIFKDEFHSNHVLVNEVQERAGDKTVVFLDSYQKPSKFWFYSGDTSMGLNTPVYRRNNYNFWKIEDSLIGKPAYMMGNWETGGFTDRFYTERMKRDGGVPVPMYYSFSRVLIDQVKIDSLPGNYLSLQFRTKTPSHYLPHFQRSPMDTASVYLAVYDEKSLLRYLPLNMSVRDIDTTLQQHMATVLFSLPPGQYRGKLAISTCLPGKPSLNSSGFRIPAAE